MNQVAQIKFVKLESKLDLNMDLKVSKSPKSLKSPHSPHSPHSPNQQQHLDFIAPINGIEKRETVSANASHNRALWKLLGEHLIKKRNSV